MLPKALREALGLGDGGPVELTLRDAHVEVAPAALEMHVVDRDGHPVIEPETEAARDLPPLTAEQVRETIQHVRR